MSMCCVNCENRISEEENREMLEEFIKFTNEKFGFEKVGMGLRGLEDKKVKGVYDGDEFVFDCYLGVIDGNMFKKGINFIDGDKIVKNVNYPFKVEDFEFIIMG